MANVFGAPKTKTRNFEVCRLVLTKHMRDADPYVLYWRDWHCKTQSVYRQYYQRNKDGIFLYKSKPTRRQHNDGYNINFNEVVLSYGIRFQFTCPKCEKSARILYLVNSCFVCRRCSGVSYESTHSGELDSLIQMIKRRRTKIFGQGVLDTYNLSYSDPSEWLPKPKWSKTHKHNLNLQKLRPLELRVEELLSDKIGEYF